MARILLIEDSPTDTAVLTQLLERNGHDVLASGSTKGMDTDKAWGLRQGAKDYIVKPPREDELIARINALLGS